ncbi:hypothetical protein SE86_01480 [Acidilobus sp. 7A]|nr:hypothetical protein SE86_01480 [Acidilobus sp. 7A]
MAVFEVSAIMAGGAGSRIGGPWKPAVRVCGRPLISHVLDAALQVSRLVIVVTSPLSSRYLRGLAEDPRASEVVLDGDGYPSDLGRLVSMMRARPLLVLPADVYGLTPEVLSHVYRLSTEAGEPVVSVKVNGSYSGISVFKGYQFEPWTDVNISANVVNVNDGDALDRARSMCMEASRG